MESASSRLMPWRRILELAGCRLNGRVIGWPKDAEALLGSFMANILGYLAHVLAPALVPLIGGELSKLIESRARLRVQSSPNIDFYMSFAPLIKIVGLQLPLFLTNWSYWVEMNGRLDLCDSDKSTIHVTDLF
jgi:hypothetical protein